MTEQCSREILTVKNWTYKVQEVWFARNIQYRAGPSLIVAAVLNWMSVQSGDFLSVFWAFLQSRHLRYTVSTQASILSLGLRSCGIPKAANQFLSSKLIWQKRKWTGKILSLPKGGGIVLLTISRNCLLCLLIDCPESPYTYLLGYKHRVIQRTTYGWSNLALFSTKSRHPTRLLGRPDASPERLETAMDTSRMRVSLNLLWDAPN